MTMPVPGMPPPGSDGRIIAISPLFEKTVLVLLAIIIAMIGAAYYGVDARINRLEDHFQTAMAADIEIKDLLKNAPHLIQDINELKQGFQQVHSEVVALRDNVKLFMPIPGSIQAIQADQQTIRIQLDNIQKQVHSIPGVPK
jgi:hypothetical protein